MDEWRSEFEFWTIKEEERLEALKAIIEELYPGYTVVSIQELVNMVPKLKRQWKSLVNPVKEPKHGQVRVLAMGELPDICPVVNGWHKGVGMGEAYIDGGAQVCVITQSCVERLGLITCGSSGFRIRLANHAKVKCLGLIKNLEVEVFSVKAMVNFHVMPAGLGAFPLILGRPWLRAVGAVQDWGKGTISVYGKKGEKLVFDMTTKQPLELEDMSENDESDITSEGSSEESESSTVSSSSDKGEVSFLLLDEEKKEVGEVMQVSENMFASSRLEQFEELMQPKQELSVKKELIQNMLRSDLAPGEKREYLTMLDKFPNLFITSYQEIRGFVGDPVKIELVEGEKPVRQKLRRMGKDQMNALKEEVDKLLNAGFIVPVDNAEWVSPVVVTPKKDGRWRVCIDYKPSNAVTKKDPYPLPFIDQLLDTVAGFERYSVCDGYSRNFQLILAPEDRKKTTFITPWGCFCFCCLPFGLTNGRLTNGPGAFERKVDWVLNPFLGKFVKVSSKKYAFMRKARKYKILDDVLYMKGSDLILRCVPWKEEIYKILEENHEGSCGGHFAVKIMLHKILQEGYVWPSIQRDVNHWCKSCESCQKMGKRILKPELQKTILAFDVFEKWGLDAIGPLPMTGKRNAYILIAVDYLSRWAEAKAVKQITSKEMGKFVYEHICCKFSVPLELLSDRGPGFRGELFDFLCSKLNIQHRYSSPYYPQCNGLNERFNGELVQIVTKMTQTHGRTWDSELPCALWAYRTAVKTSTWFSPYHLVNGKEALLPIEVKIPALKLLSLGNGEQNNTWQKRLLDLQCLQLDRILALNYYEEVTKKAQIKANECVKDKGIEKGDLVLRYNSKLDNTFQKKFQIKWEGPFTVVNKFDNGTYQLADLDGAEHKYRVNGYRLKKYLARLMTVVTEEMLTMEKENDKVIENVKEVSGDELQQLFTLETSAYHE
ncbi:hypothetical protein L7F22_008994 [Adiantum nelumboides]|nr:hypothetical protein [Adiantum nelumboides]